MAHGVGADDAGEAGVVPAYATLLPTPLSDRESRLLERARMHAADFETRAEAHDREGSFPEENFAAMKASGYAHMTLPESYGGEGVSLLELCACQEQLGRGCAGTAIAVNMHMFTLGALLTDMESEGEVRRAQLEAGLRVIGRRRHIVAGSFSERGRPGAYLLPQTKGRRVEGGWEITGRKAYASNWPVAEVVAGLVHLEGHAEGADRVAMVSVPQGTPGLSSPGAASWDVLGLRASGSYEVVWDKVFVPEMMMPPTRPAAALFSDMTAFAAWFNLTISAVYLGVAQAAVEWAIDFLRSRQPATEARPLSHMPGLQYQLGEMVALQAASRSLIRTSAEDWMSSLSGAGPWGVEEAAVKGGICKYVTSSNQVRVVNLAMDIAGGPGLFRSEGLERRYRDVRGSKVHPPSDVTALELIAKQTLGIAGDFVPRWG